METLIQWGIIPVYFHLTMNMNDRVGGTREAVRSVKEAEHIPEKLVNIKERVGSWRTDIKFNQVTEEKFEKVHEIEVYDHLKKKLLKIFSNVFKEDLEPSDRLDVPSVRIPLKPNQESIPTYNAKVPIPTPCYLERAAQKELARIIKSGALEEVTHPTDNCCKAFFVQKPGSPHNDPSVSLVNNMKPVNPRIESPGYPMDGSSNIMRRLEPGDVCFGVIDLVQGFHQIPVHEDSRGLLTIILPQGKYCFTCLPQGLVCSTDFFNLLTDPDNRNKEGFYKNVDDILTAAQDIRQLESRLKKLLTICRKRNMKISPSKFKVVSSVTYGGTVIESVMTRRRCSSPLPRRSWTPS